MNQYRRVNRRPSYLGQAQITFLSDGKVGLQELYGEYRGEKLFIDPRYRRQWPRVGEDWLCDMERNPELGCTCLFPQYKLMAHPIWRVFVTEDLRVPSLEVTRQVVKGNRILHQS